MRKKEIDSDLSIAQAAFLPFQQLIIANNEPIGNYANLLGKVAHLWVGKYAERNLSQCQSRFKTNLPKKFWPWTVLMVLVFLFFAATIKVPQLIIDSREGILGDQMALKCVLPPR